MSADTAFEVGRLYGPLKRLSDVIVGAQRDIFIKLPAISGYFPMSIVDVNGGAVNHAAGDIDASMVGIVPLAFDGNSYRQLGNGVNYLNAPGAYILTGVETYVDSSVRGWTIGGWFMIDNLPVNVGGVISRDGGSAQRGYSIQVRSTGIFRGSVSLSGVGVTQVNSGAFPIGVWQFVALRFKPSVEIAIFVNGTKTVNTTAIPASTFVSSEPFQIGRTQGSDLLIADAKVRDVFVSQSALSDELLALVKASSAPN